MTKVFITISSLLLGVGILLAGNGLQGTLLVLRGASENYSENTIGLIMSMYFIGFIIGSFLCPKIIQRVRHIRAFSILAAVCASTMVLIGLWVNPWVWGVMRCIMGICIVGIFMVSESWLNILASNVNRGRMFGIYILVNLVFLAAGQFLILAGDIQSLDLFAISAALFSISLVPVAMTRIPEPASISTISLDLSRLYRISALGFTGSLISGLLNSIFWSLGPLFARLSGLTEFGIAMFMSITILGGIIMLWPIGQWSDRVDRRRVILFVSSVSVLISIIAIMVPTDTYYWLAICMFVYGGMLFSIYPLSVAHANDHPDAEDRVMVTTNMLFIYGIGAVFGPVICGMLMKLFGPYSMFGMFIAGGFFLAGYAYYYMKRGLNISDEDKTHYAPYIRTSQVAVDLESSQ